MDYFFSDGRLTARADVGFELGYDFGLIRVPDPEEEERGEDGEKAEGDEGVEDRPGAEAFSVVGEGSHLNCSLELNSWAVILTLRLAWFRLSELLKNFFGQDAQDLQDASSVELVLWSDGGYFVLVGKKRPSSPFW